MKKIIFRTDSAFIIGSGHLMRCLTLADELKQNGAEIKFISRDLPENLTEIAEKKGYKVYKLPYKNKKEIIIDDYSTWLGTDFREDAEETIKILEQESPDWIIIDHYAIDIKWEQIVRPYVKKIMVIDDLANRQHDCDLLLDQNLVENMENRYNKLVPAHCKKLLGPSYALLRPEFREARKKLKKRDGTVRRILIFFGGSDPTNETEKALRAVLMLNRPDITVDVVVGKANPHKEKIKKLCAIHSNVNYYCQVNNMAELMAEADLAIGAGGATTWERCYMGLPSVVIDIAENQKIVTDYLSKSGFIIYLGISEEVDIYRIHEEIAKIIENTDILLSIKRKYYELRVGSFRVSPYI
ncbi:UDP-2,4-diacetamido-2,4,6-trideoxy-beta-L-altropyranose hydrolase [Thermosyntropha sp.]|uniref:UDP-2,4-diacetamido-2,4, 6-trideoxy-beta-L-altropyranose hydrolase n=1 Tax=Thermosyntropha sp. TaxID=2740820 RepID=UPI0025EB392F|nr:UDP-2,4-diacetamido-2,4,6-trideoxy-beta-L-altropyranose hydrolase [Thermosyntropha sp.]MBO8158623.1 UDP-2,4-diacetamido-2,4,6-trideoxy-beta-L-altropyranose hydrolase [Thermosyntropha sp.]